MITTPLHQGGDSLSAGIHLFETEIKPSRALTIIRRTMIGTGMMVLTAAPFMYWIRIASMPDDEFDVCCFYSGPTLEEQGMMLVCFNVFAALLGVFFYLIRNPVSNLTHHKKRQERKPLRVTLWRESNPLSNVKVAAPCTVEWRWMYGNDRVRFCNQCRLNVYNLSAMTKWEAEDLIRNTEGRLCVKFYRRADGTILTQNCPAGLQAIKEKFNRARTHILGAAFSVLGFFGFIGAYKFTARTTGSTKSLVAPFQHKVMEVLQAPFPHEMLGEMVVPYKQTILQRSESFIRQKAIFKVSPVHHATNGHLRIKGEAVVKIIISENGEVENAELIKGHPLLQALVEEAASRWKFAPMLSHDLPTKIESHLTFHFR